MATTTTGFTAGTALEGKYEIVGLLGAGGMGDVDHLATWEKGTASAWEEYLKTYPEAPRTVEALRCRKEAAEYELAEQMNTAVMWRAFLKAWPDGRHRLDAELRLRG